MSNYVKLALLTMVVGIALFSIAILHKWGVLISNVNEDDLFQTLGYFYTTLCAITCISFFIHLYKEWKK